MIQELKIEHLSWKSSVFENFGHGHRWLHEKITKITGPVSYSVLLDDGRQ